MNFSTTPPYRSITVRADRKYPPDNSRTSSPSRPSDKDVKATKSTNNTDTNRNSGTATVGADANADSADAGSPDPLASAVPHSLQNL